MTVIHRIALFALITFAAAACGGNTVTLANGEPPPGGGSTDPPGGVDPCAGKDLPACPSACGADAQAGQACTKEGERCGNNIGDGCACEGGTWRCQVHPPGSPGCNQVCK